MIPLLKDHPHFDELNDLFNDPVPQGSIRAELCDTAQASKGRLLLFFSEITRDPFEAPRRFRIPVWDTDDYRPRLAGPSFRDLKSGHWLLRIAYTKSNWPVLLQAHRLDEELNGQEQQDIQIEGEEA